MSSNRRTFLKSTVAGVVWASTATATPVAAQMPAPVDPDDLLQERRGAGRGRRSARDPQYLTSQFTIGKTFDGFAPLWR